MRYAKIREMDISNGSGVGVSLFVQGCHFHCKGCFNTETWDFEGGKEWTPEIEEQFFKLVDKPYISRISILGGEPLADENVEYVTSLIIKLKFRFPEKQIWIYTGYTFDDIVLDEEKTDCWNTKFDLMRGSALYFADIVVDGQFQLEKQDLFNKEIVWAGSTNQRVIDSAKSLENKEIVLYSCT